MEVKKHVRLGCPSARAPQSTRAFLGFSSAPKYHNLRISRIVCKHGLSFQDYKWTPQSVVSPPLASTIGMVFNLEFREGDVKQVFPYMTESGLVYSALRAQVLWLIELLSEEISQEDESFLRSLVNRDTASRISNKLLCAYESDMYLYYAEAVRSYLKEEEGMWRFGTAVDSGCTKEDIDRLARGLTLKDAMDKLILPAMDDLIAAMDYAAAACAVGDLNHIASKLGEQRAEISHFKIGGGGDFCAPNAQLAQSFVGSLGLSMKPFTYQTLTPLISRIAIFNTVLIDFDALMVEMKMGADFARSKSFLSCANSGFSLLDKYFGTKEERALPPISSYRPAFFIHLVEELAYSLVGYQIAQQGITKLKQP